MNDTEKKLFYEMDISTQKHSIKVALKCIEISKKHPIEPTDLAKAGLLHDIGKKSDDLSTIDRSIIVLLEKASPKLAHSLAKKGRGNKINNFRHALYIYYNHSTLGAKILESIHTKKEIINLTRDHHNPPLPTDSTELKILQQADNTN